MNDDDPTSRDRPSPGSFQNRYTAFEPKGLADVLRWRWRAHRDGLPPKPSAAIPQVAPDLGFIGAVKQTRQAAVTWIGHACALVQCGGLNWLTDPMFSDRASPLSWIGPQRAHAPGVALDQLPPIDVVVISHNHYDHLDDASVQALNRQPGGPPLFVVPLGLKAWLDARGIKRAVELNWWQSHRVEHPLGDCEVVLTPSQHWSGRGLHDRMKTLWGGFAVFTPGFHWFYAGDTGYSRDFSDLRDRFADRQTVDVGGGFDLALLPIGAYEPRWFMQVQHVNPMEAVQIHHDLGAKRSLGVHWGCFQLTDEALDQPPRDLAVARGARGIADDAFFVLAVGETRPLPPR